MLFWAIRFKEKQSMDDALPRRMFRGREADQPAQPRSGAAVRAGGPGNDEPVLIARISGPVRIEMAQQALRDADIPVYIKRDSMGVVYGLSTGPLSAGEVWVPGALAEQAKDVLMGIGLLED